MNRNGNQKTSPLAQRLAAGDESAIAFLYRQYYNRLLLYGLQVAGNFQQHEVEDVIQEFFMWMAEHYPKMAAVEDLEAYLFRSIRRNLHSRYTARQRSQASLKRYFERRLPQDDEFHHSPEQIQVRKEEEQHIQYVIRQQLQQLPDYQREVLYLRYFENRSYSEIADLLTLNHQVVYNYVSRGIKRLKKQFADLVISALYWTIVFSAIL